MILLLFCFNRSKSICLGLGYGIFHTQYPAVLYTEGFVTVCVETPILSQRDVIIWTFPTYIPQRKKMYGNFLIRKLTSLRLKRTVAVGSNCSRDQSTRTSCGIRIEKSLLSTRLRFHIMEKSATKSPISSHKRTPLGGGKRSRKAHCRKAAESRWKKKKADESLACSQLGESETHTLTIIGDAEILSSGNQQAPAEQPNDPCMAKKNLDRRRRHLGPTNDATDTEQKRCFLELPSLQSLFTDVACGECGAVGSLDVSFGEKMGYSRQISLVCQVCK